MSERRDRSVPDSQWFAVRQAAREGRWLAVLRFAESRGSFTLAFHARRLATLDGTEEEGEFSMYVVAMALLLDRPDQPDPFAELPNG
jgi:hypothetical protein